MNGWVAAVEGGRILVEVSESCCILVCGMNTVELV